jgi:hypothetical protein
MINFNVAIAVALVLSLVYLGLAAKAYRHMRREPKTSEVQRLLAFTLWWPFYDAYEPHAKRLRIVGVVVLLVCLAAYSAAFFVGVPR